MRRKKIKESALLYFKAKQGFLLTEQLIYVVILVLLSSLTVIYAIKMRAQSARVENDAQYFAQLCAAQDKLLWDLYNAPVQKKEWLKLDEHEIIFINKNGMAIGWFVSKNRLMRAEGQFNNRWIKKNASVVAQAIENLRFIISQNDATVNTITFILKQEGQKEIVQKVQREQMV